MNHAYPLIAPGDIQDIEGITPLAIVLYANLYGLMQVSGYCWAGNDYLCARMRVSERTLQRALLLLSKLGLIRVEVQGNQRRIYSTPSPVATPSQMATAPVTDDGLPPPLSSNNKKRELNKAKFQIEIEEAFRGYPNRKGKTKGIERLASQIKTDAQMQDLKTAIQNYALECKDRNPQYIKHFSTFANCWQDYLEVTPQKKQSSDWIAMKLVDGQMVPMTDN